MSITIFIYIEFFTPLFFTDNNLEVAGDDVFNTNPEVVVVRLPVVRVVSLLNVIVYQQDL